MRSTWNVMEKGTLPWEDGEQIEGSHITLRKELLLEETTGKEDINTGTEGGYLMTITGVGSSPLAGDTFSHWSGGNSNDGN
ncbi:hypothetical protein AVEN_24870-1 [Araneus ventricosus]|uniref:Uncharacterized protein n=1 Tax=Araneus ventricosus TaxID=182803 RepID=A0A4Y2JP30_ARAVE|nr:hypothetical protein AVEN_24870-1 [Araneus ventricosus]